jgi:hypothetical protein
MWKPLFAACIVLGLAACGGGGSSAGVDALLPSAEVLKGKPVAAETTLVAQPLTRVNTTIAGNQEFRSIGALTDGGYTVAWLSENSTLLIQRYDSAGNQVGGEVPVALVIPSAQSPGVGDPLADPGAALRDASVAVLGDGSVVVAYEIDRFLEQVGAFFQFKEGIYLQRFDANGVQLAGETEVFSQIEARNNRPVFLSDPKVVALADGGFSVAWVNLIPPLTTDSTNTLYKQRFDSTGQPLGGVVTVGRFLQLGASGLRLAADASGGYTMTITFQGGSTEPFDRTAAIHFDATDVATQIVAPRPGNMLLLPLEGDRYVLFASDSSGTFRQFLDSAGNPVGTATPVPSLPFGAQELADGSFVVDLNLDGNLAWQRFDSSGTLVTDLQTIATHAGTAGAVPLANGGFAAAWSGPSGAGDTDVFTTQLLEVLAPTQAQLRAKRKACLASAKGMTGQDRKAFMDACLAA